ncbi:hypothetical protein N8979_00590 [bacterium]|nr:hypothetical protein [bacterium]
MSHWKKVVSTALSLIFIGGTIVGTAKLAFAGAKDDTLRMGFTRESDTLDVYFNSTREGVVMAHLIWDALLWRNPKTAEYEPGLADSWSC